MVERRDEYAIFTPEWYQAVKRLEPQIDQIIKKVFEGQPFSGWKYDEFRKRITG